MIRLRIVRSCLDLGSTPLYENQHTNLEEQYSIIAYSGRSCLDLGSPPPLCENRHLDLFDSVKGSGLGGFVFRLEEELTPHSTHTEVRVLGGVGIELVQSSGRCTAPFARRDSVFCLGERCRGLRGAR